MKASRIALGLIFVLALANTAMAAGPGVSDHQISDFWARVMNFAVMAGVLFFVLRKPVGQLLGKRTKDIQDELADLEAQRDEARKEFAEMERRLKDAEGEREKILQDFRSQGEKEKAQIIENANNMAERIKAQAQFAIEQETDLAKTELKREVAELSAALAEDLLKQNINAEDQNRLVDEYLTKVGQELQ